MAKVATATLHSICNKVASYYPEAKLDLLRQAYQFAAEDQA